MAIKKDTFTRQIKGITHTVYPEHIKKEIVAELESGLISIKEAMVKYGIHYDLTLKEWLKKYSTLDKHSYQRTKTTPSLRRQAIREIESGKLSLQEASQKYHVAEDTLKRWIRRNSRSLINPQQEMENPKLPVEGHNQLVLLKTIEDLKLKVAGLETMIDIAEKELKVDIRKKSGTRQ